MLCLTYELCKIQFTGFYCSSTFNISTTGILHLTDTVTNAAVQSLITSVQANSSSSSHSTVANYSLHITSLPDGDFLSRGRKDLNSGLTFSAADFSPKNPPDRSPGGRRKPISMLSAFPDSPSAQLVKSSYWEHPSL